MFYANFDYLPPLNGHNLLYISGVFKSVGEFEGDVLLPTVSNPKSFISFIIYYPSEKLRESQEALGIRQCSPAFSVK